jgi:hypothetical protein
MGRRRVTEALPGKQKKLAMQSRGSLLANFELQKFVYIHAELKSMLAAVESYTEKEWQKKMLGLLLFIFPKYIAVLENVHVKDFYSNPCKVSDRYIDLMLLSGWADIEVGKSIG